jgi:hypothetical protein
MRQNAWNYEDRIDLALPALRIAGTGMTILWRLHTRFSSRLATPPDPKHRTASTLLPQTRFRRLSHLPVALPAFVLQNEALNRDRRGVGAEIGEGFEQRRPEAENFIGDDFQFAGFPAVIAWSAATTRS